MPRYYFDVANRVRLTDPDGTELANGSSAFVHALQVVRELMFGRTKMLGQLWSAWTMLSTIKPGRRYTQYRLLTFPKAIARTEMHQGQEEAALAGIACAGAP